VALFELRRLSHINRYWSLERNHQLSRSLSRHDLRRSNADMDFRKSFSKPFKKLKGKLPGGNRKRDGRSGGESDRKGREAEIEGGEVSQRNSYPHSEVDIEGAVGGVHNQEGSDVGGGKAARVDVPPVSLPSISRSGEPDSA